MMCRWKKKEKENNGIINNESMKKYEDLIEIYTAISNIDVSIDDKLSYAANKLIKSFSWDDYHQP